MNGNTVPAPLYPFQNPQQAMDMTQQPGAFPFQQPMDNSQFGTLPFQQPTTMQAPMGTAMPPSSFSPVPDNNLTPLEPDAIINPNAPETYTNPIYTAAFLRRQIGKYMKVDFLIGNALTDRVGRLVQVGASYIILYAESANVSIMCDLYAIKFVSIVNNPSFYQSQLPVEISRSF